METAKRVFNILGIFLAVVSVFFFFLLVFGISGFATWEELGHRLSEFRYIPTASTLTCIGSLVFLVTADVIRNRNCRTLLLVAAMLSAFASVVILFI